MYCVLSAPMLELKRMPKNTHYCPERGGLIYSGVPPVSGNVQVADPMIIFLLPSAVPVL